MLWALLIATLAAVAPQPATPSPGSVTAGTPQQTAGLDADSLPVDIERIQRALAQPPAIRIDGNRPVFRVEVFGTKPTMEDILGPEFWKGPVQYGGMTHQEFLNMVTPKDVQGYAAFNNKEAATVAATSFLLKWALQKAVQKYKEAQTERAREAARKEVDAALAELDEARRKAGLPPR
jgi:hypothetical protein